MLLARRGRRVLILDRAAFPSDTMSTHFFCSANDGLPKTWGLLDRLAAPADHPRALDDGRLRVRGCAEPGAWLCHHVLSPAHGARCHAGRGRGGAGAEVREGVNVRDLLWSDGRVTGVVAQDARGERLELRARIVVGADGMNSRIARSAAAPYKVYEEPITFAFYAYWNDVPLDHFGGHRSAGSRVLMF